MRVGDVVKAHERSLSSFHRGAGSALRLPHSELEGTTQTLVLLSGDLQVGDTTCRTVVELATRRIGNRAAAPSDGHSISVISNLLRDAEAVYTDGSYRTGGNLFGRIRGTATGEGSASILARVYDGSYKAVRVDLTGMIDSAATAELV